MYSTNNIRKKLDKLVYVIGLSGKYNKHKKNYNAAAVLLMSNIKPPFNKVIMYPGQDPLGLGSKGFLNGGSLVEKFRKQFGNYARIVNQTAKSDLAQKIVNNPVAMKAFFNRRNGIGVRDPILNAISRGARSSTPNVRSRSSTPNMRSRSSTPNVRSRSSTPNVRYRSPTPNVRSRSSTPNVRSRSSTPNVRSRSSTPNSKCTFKKLSAWGTPICR